MRSPDPCANPYIAYALLIYAGLDGIEKNLKPSEPLNVNLYTAGTEITDRLTNLPDTLAKARAAAANSEFIKRILPNGFI